MTRIVLFTIGLAVTCVLQTAAQEMDSVTVKSKLSTTDSLKVTDLFFSALRQKEAGSLEEAAQSLLQIINIDTQKLKVAKTLKPKVVHKAHSGRCS